MAKLKQSLDLPGRPDAEEPNMTEHELAARECVTVRTVREWRQKGTGPKFRKLGPGRGALVISDNWNCGVTTTRIAGSRSS